MKKFLIIFCVLIMILSVSGCSKKKGVEGKTNKILIVVPPEQIMDVEFEGAEKILGEKYDLVVASTVKGKVTGENLEINSDILISKAKVKKYDAIVLIGGMGVFSYIIDNKDVHTLVNQFASEGKLVTATCGATLALGKAGILDGLVATTYPDAGLISQLEELGATYSDELVVVSGNIITGAGPRASKEFPQAVAEALE